MTYKDMTFCEFYLKCKQGIYCKRALTEKVMQGFIAYRLNSSMGISIFLSEPECYSPIVEEKPIKYVDEILIRREGVEHEDI